MKCTQCGAENSAAASFCTLCFAPVARTLRHGRGREPGASSALADRFAAERVEQHHTWANRSSGAARVAAVAIPMPEFVQAQAVDMAWRRRIEGTLAGAVVFALVATVGVWVLTLTNWAGVTAWDSSLLHSLGPAAMFCVVAALFGGTVCAAVASREYTLVTALLAPAIGVGGVLVVRALVGAESGAATTILNVWALVVAVIAGLVAAAGSRAGAEIAEQY